MCRFHELAGESDKAWELRERQFTEIEGKGFFHGEVWVRILRCRLLGRMGQPLEAELAETYKSIENLLKPESFIKKIKRIESGNYSEKRNGD